MDKSTYETYEFLPANSSEPEADQFFIVQDDGTFLINRQIQYVAQVQDVKEVLEDVQPCTVYDVSSQQFFVDNSTELISVSDQFILPNGANNLYSNSYLLQPATSGTPEQMDEDVVIDQYKHTNSQEADVDGFSHNSKQTNNCTEITLSDEQYQMLEQKGWILLESNEKIFVLNTLGLHDITTNNKLIQKLKSEIPESTNAFNSGCLKIESVSTPLSLISQNLGDQQDAVELVIDNKNITHVEENTDNLPFIVDEKVEQKFDQTLHESQVVEIPSNYALFNDTPKENTVTDEIQKACDTSLKIKTKYTFKDIPEKIFLGKTVNGKRLFAKVIKSHITKNNASVNKEGDEEMDYDKSLVSPKVTYKEVGKHQYINNSGLNESQFLSLIQQTVRGNPLIKQSAEDIVSAESVIEQLVRAPNLRKTIIGQSLIITKITSSEDEKGNVLFRSKPSLITGIVTMTDPENGHFTHLPNMLQKIMAESEIKSNTGRNVYKDGKIQNTNINIFHIHIWETKFVNSISQMTVRLNKRQLSLDLVLDLNKRHPVAVYACAACAALFKSETTLKEHQESQCIVTDDTLTIDTDNINESSYKYHIVKNGKKNMYVCKICEAKFVRLSNCQKHVKTHTTISGEKPITNESTLNQTDNNTIENNKQTEVFRCKMCPSTYFHSSSLSKHIMTRHIHTKSN